jgi:outer membrane lipoprotein-sorting protein
MKKIFSLLLVLFSFPAFAGQAEDLKRLDEYLNALSTISADFTQVAPDGTLTSGKFYLKRPGQMRWQYEPPTPILMIANGGEIIFYDYELQQLSHIPVDSTIASFISRPKISLRDNSIEMVDFESQPGAIRVTIRQKGKPENGTLMLEFSDYPLQIRNMVVTDAQNQVTTVSLNNAVFGHPLEKSLFIFRDPRKKK